MSRQGLRFLVVGGANTLGSYLLYCLLLRWIGAQQAWLASYAVGMLVGYVGHSRLVFGSELRPRRALGYVVLQLLMYLLSSAILALGLNRGLDPRVAAAFTFAFTVPISFVLSRRLLAATPRAPLNIAIAESGET